MTKPDYRAMCAELVDACVRGGNLAKSIFRARALLDQPVAEGPTDEEIRELLPQQMLYDLAAAARGLLAQPVAEGPIATEHARTQEINDLIAETVYGPEGSETPACANAWEVSKLIASLQTRVKALEALDD